jgi:predicted  nucleic acid-binding Zn-ribbon protein
MNWQYETIDEKLARLRGALAQAQDDLIDKEAELADRMAEIVAFELEFESKVGHLIDQLADVEAELEEYHRKIQRLRDERVFGRGYSSVEEQYRRTWEVPPKSAATPPSKPLPPASEVEIKKLYRRLARRFHPDLAQDEADRAYRTDKMQAINDAYAARSMIELVALAEQLDSEPARQSTTSGKTDADMIRALEKEISRCHGRMRQIDNELRNLHNRPSVEVSLEVKFAQRQGRDLLKEMAVELERKIARKSVERDMIKAQFDSLDRGQSTIQLS